MSQRNACDTGLLHKKTVKRRIKNELLMDEKVKELRVIAANELLQSNCDALASPPTHLLASSSVIRSLQPSKSSNSESVKNLFYQNRDGNPVSQVVQLNHGEVFSEDTSEIENYYSAVNASNIEHNQHGLLQDQHHSNSDDSAISDTQDDEVFTCKTLTHHQSVYCVFVSIMLSMKMFRGLQKYMYRRFFP
ncbi:uncharacterized protein LOC124193984 [Daphnia pulex]|uniref:uncharacterized protein LOC124193984 n=1 Tax=Daphnia pulex TaxID=6669 RepID=UPI001EDF5364|nr:uncharacterized protein LOC124193984 [Daphnia pulex]